MLRVLLGFYLLADSRSMNWVIGIRKWRDGDELGTHEKE